MCAHVSTPMQKSQLQIPPLRYRMTNVERWIMTLQCKKDPLRSGPFNNKTELSSCRGSLRAEQLRDPSCCPALS